jgi:hypothetical protein
MKDICVYAYPKELVFSSALGIRLNVAKLAFLPKTLINIEPCLVIVRGRITWVI